MHELSIAESIAAQVRRHGQPPGDVCSVEIRVGPFRGLDQTSLELC